MIDRKQTKYKQIMGQFEESYRKFAKMRGFKSFNDFAYHKRGFIECWAQPGFHKFWQVWNPGIAYFVYQIYLMVGGRKNWIFPTIFSFIICGILHTVIVFPFIMRWSYSVIITFACFGVLTVISKKLSAVLKQEKWPWVINTLINIGLVIISFDTGFRINRIIS